MKLRLLCSLAALSVLQACERSIAPAPETAPLFLAARAANTLVHDAGPGPNFPEAAIGSDPSPGSPGLWLGSDVNPMNCFRQMNPAAIATRADDDNDWLYDECEFKIANGFRPGLFGANECVGAEPYWAAKYFEINGVKHVRVLYMLAYYYDCGYPTWGGGSGPGDGETIMLEVTHAGSSGHWQFNRMWLSDHGDLMYYDWMDARVTYGGHAMSPARGWPNVWVSEGKHANFVNRSGCDYPDVCNDNLLGRVSVFQNRNVGEVRSNGTAYGLMPDPCPLSVENPANPRTECFVVPKGFNGWYEGEGGGSYYSDLIGPYGMNYSDPGPGPTEPPPVVSISGPLSFPGYQTQTWTADVNAVAPYTRQWYVDGVAQIEMTPTISRSFPPASTHTINVVVSAGDGTSSGATINVQTFNDCPAPCEEWLVVGAPSASKRKPLVVKGLRKRR